jgi:hypothetical protein
MPCASDRDKSNYSFLLPNSSVLSINTNFRGSGFEAVGMAFITHGEKRNAYRILVEKPKESDHYEDLHIGGRTILKLFLEIRCDNMDWRDLAQDRNQWRAPVNTVMNLWVPSNVGKFFGT